MKVPFTWKVTGWFMVGWSAEFPASEVRPLRYFGEDLVAYRDESGGLHVLSGHCRHLGAHIGHGGKVVGDCVEYPFHGWRWGPDGTNRYIPYQPDRPNKALRLRVYPVREQYGCVFVWHQPDGKEPQWEMPDLFHLTFFGGSPVVHGREEADPVLRPAERAALVWPLLLFDVALDDSQRSASAGGGEVGMGTGNARPTGISGSRWGTAGAAGERTRL